MNFVATIVSAIDLGHSLKKKPTFYWFKSHSPLLWLQKADRQVMSETVSNNIERELVFVIHRNSSAAFEGLWFTWACSKVNGA